MSPHQFSEVIFKPWELMNEIIKIVRLASLDKMVNRFDASDGECFIVFICSANVKPCDADHHSCDVDHPLNFGHFL